MNPECENHAENMEELSKLWVEEEWLLQRLKKISDRIAAIQNVKLGERA